MKFIIGFGIKEKNCGCKPQYESCLKCKTLFTHIYVPLRMRECEMSGPEVGGAISLKY